MTSVIRSLSLFAAVATLAAFASAQPAAQTPDMILAVGGGTTLDGHYALTGSFGKSIASDTFSVTSTDMSTSAVYDAKTKLTKRVAVATVRSGIQRVILRSGPITLAAHVDAGLTTGADALVGNFSGGGTIAYDVPKHPNLFLYGTYRAIRSPTAGPTASAVTSAASFGIGLKLFKGN